MKRSIISSLQCADCGNSFRLQSAINSGDEVDVIEGILSCDCGARFPIANGIPRFLPQAQAALSGSTEAVSEELQAFLAKWSRTQSSFGTQWNRYEVQCLDEDIATFQAKTGFDVNSLTGLRVLDAGCGGGRYSFVAGSAGAELTSVDISSAVNKAARLCESLPNVQVLQANLMKLPLPANSFDRIFSIGVLHHTPDTRAAFDALIPLLKPGGNISIWLYPKWDRFREAMNTFWRSMTTRMPHSCIHALSIAASPVGRVRGKVYDSGPKWLARVLWQTDKLMPGVSNHPDPRQRVCDTFDWFTPQYQWHHTDDEVRRWFEEASLVDVVNLSESKSRYHVGQGHGACFTGKRPTI